MSRERVPLRVNNCVDTAVVVSNILSRLHA